MRKLSVVMGVYNGAALLPASLDSILAQTEPDFELIVVDDGSTDETPEILRDYADRDVRIRVIAQANRGLTAALIAGCADARSPFIARHDCGDRSSPERFRKQLDAFREDVVLVSCLTRYVAPEGELLYVNRANGDDVRRSLLSDGVNSIHGLTSHGSAMFRRNAYEAVGGYRAEFRYAQDLDLWIRLASRGEFVVLDEILYEATYEITGISVSRRERQVDLASVSIALRDGGPREELLERARTIGSERSTHTPLDDAKALYFIASCLRRNGDPRYKRYARQAVRRDPLHARAWLLLFR